jgi:hypothetical protein
MVEYIPCIPRPEWAHSREAVFAAPCFNAGRCGGMRMSEMTRGVSALRVTFLRMHPAPR